MILKLWFRINNSLNFFSVNIVNIVDIVNIINIIRKNAAKKLVVESPGAFFLIRKTAGGSSGNVLLPRRFF